MIRSLKRKRRTCIGLYLKPPAHAAVFCVDEKSAIQALDRLDPVLPLSPGRAERHGFEYYRHGTLPLYGALNTQTGEVLAKTSARHTSAEFVDFLAVTLHEIGRLWRIFAASCLFGSLGRFATFSAWGGERHSAPCSASPFRCLFYCPTSFQVLHPSREVAQ